MKMVSITHVDPFKKVSGRIFHAVCDYDPDLIEAHMIAREMADLMGVPMSELKYRIFEKASRFGAIMSLDARNLDDVQLLDSRISRMESESAVAGSFSGEKIDWHQFYEINVFDYEMLTAGMIQEDAAGDVF